MEQQERKKEKIFPLKLDRSGRMVLPADSKLRHSIADGESLVGVEEADGSLRLRTYSQVVREVQDFFAQYKVHGVNMVDELIAERRAEAERE